MTKSNAVRTIYRRDRGKIKWVILLEEGVLAQGSAKNKTTAASEARAARAELAAAGKLKGWQS